MQEVKDSSDHGRYTKYNYRMGTQLGLRDMVANHCDNFNKLSTIPPRMLQIPTTLIEQEENIRAYWMTELLDSSYSRTPFFSSLK
jgi:hypothetical protein